MFGPSQLAQRLPSPATALPSAPPPPPAQQQPSAPAVRSVASLSQFDAILTSNRCVAVDFTSANCGPCRVISPEFERLIDEYERNFQPKGILVGTRNSQKIVGVKVEVGMAREIAARYNISVTPTFVFFLDGKQFHDFKGANPQELKTSIELLLFTAYPPHPHVKVKTPTLDKFPSAPILYTQSTNLKAIFTKLAEFTAQHSVTMDSSVLDGIRDGLQAKHETKVKETLVLPGRWAATVSGLLDDLPTEQLFPLLDIVRLLVLDDGVRDHYVRDKDATLMKIMYRCGGGQSQPEELPKAVRLMALRLACNLFASPTSTTYLLSLTRTIPPSSTPHRSVVTALLIETLLSADASVRQGAASLAFNIAVTEAKYRDSGSGGVEGQEEEEGMHEEWVAELVAAVAKAVEVEEDDEIVLRLLASLCHLLRYAPAPIIQLAAVVGVEAAVDAKRAKREGLPGAGVTADEKLKKEADKRAKVVGLCSEVAELVKVGGGQA
ncbi:hypothetical protein HK104_008560 [Borealophlyctis nickersoniae]|nr:hypothetical protein HK104_008560 [Borealophlyctis nickersoniae]